MSGDLEDQIFPVTVSPAVRGSPQTEAACLLGQERQEGRGLLGAREGAKVGSDVPPAHPPHAAVGKEDVGVSPEGECRVEEVVQHPEFPGVEVAAVGESLDAEKDVSLGWRPPRGQEHFLRKESHLTAPASLTSNPEQRPRVEDQS